ncbi:MAG: Mth938-like domain-containing protein [Sulfuricellaceae bacterium]
MKLHLAVVGAQNHFTAYDAESVTVNHTRYLTSLIVLPDQPVENWPPTSLEHLETAHFDTVVAHAPEIILLGVGARLRFPAREIRLAWARLHIGVEVMDTYAACRTYNILAGEGRRVAAALILGG